MDAIVLDWPHHWILRSHHIRNRVASYGTSKQGCRRFRRGSAGQDRSIDDECAIRLFRRPRRFRSHGVPARDHIPAHPTRAHRDRRDRTGFDCKDKNLAGAAGTKAAKTRREHRFRHLPFRRSPQGAICTKAPILAGNRTAAGGNAGAHAEEFEQQGRRSLVGATPAAAP
jgi:hypothetical protein